MQAVVDVMRYQKVLEDLVSQTQKNTSKLSITDPRIEVHRSAWKSTSGPKIGILR